MSKHLLVCPIKLVQCWLHTSWVAFHKAYAKRFASPSENMVENEEKKKQRKQLQSFFALYANPINQYRPGKRSDFWASDSTW